MLHPRGDAFAHKDSCSILLVQICKARCQIHRIAESRVVHAFHRAEVADDGLPDMNAKPCEEWRQAFSFELSVELLARHSARKNCAASALDMVGLRIGCVPEHHHGVANKLVDCSAFGEESLCKHGEIPRHLAHEHFGGG